MQEGPEPNIITFNAFISALRDAEMQWSRVLRVLQQLATYPIEADDFTLVASISSIGSRRWRPALRLLVTSRSQSTECKEPGCFQGWVKQMEGLLKKNCNFGHGYVRQVSRFLTHHHVFFFVGSCCHRWLSQIVPGSSKCFDELMVPTTLEGFHGSMGDHGTVTS